MSKAACKQVIDGNSILKTKMEGVLNTNESILRNIDVIGLDDGFREVDRWLDQYKSLLEEFTEVTRNYQLQFDNLCGTFPIDPIE